MQGARCASVIFRVKHLATRQLCKNQAALGAKNTKYFWIIFAQTAENNISPLFHNLNHFAFLKIPLSLFVREMWTKRILLGGPELFLSGLSGCL